MEETTETKRILVVSRETSALRALWSIAESNAWRLETAANGWEAMERVQSGLTPHLLILDLPCGDGDTLHVLRWLRRLRPELPILVLCNAADAEKRDGAIRLGAEDVLVRPFPDEQLGFAIYRLLRRPSAMQAEVESENIVPLGEDNFFVCASPLMRKLRTQAELLAQADVPVLILGEQGSGKTTLARLIHRLSVRSGFRFLKISCRTMAGGPLDREATEVTSAIAPLELFLKRFEIAEKGVVLFDEITEMPSNVQIRLLEVLEDESHEQNRKVGRLRPSIRILASTTSNIERALAEKKLNEELYYRLSAFTVHVPPLRQRKEEVGVFLRYSMQNLAKHYGLPSREFSPAVIDICENYSWPGNLTELETFVKRYLVGGEAEVYFGSSEGGTDGMGVAMKPNQADPASKLVDQAQSNSKSLKSVVQSVKSETERNAIGVALKKTSWNRKAAARLLQVSYRNLLYKIEQYHLNSSESFLSPLPGVQSSLSGADTKGKGKAS